MFSAFALPAKRYEQEECRKSRRVKRGNDHLLLEMPLAQEKHCVLYQKTIDDWRHVEIVPAIVN